jgi:modulator of FtsH protease HflK
MRLQHFSLINMTPLVFVTRFKWPKKLLGIFNLNEGHWGRGDTPSQPNGDQSGGSKGDVPDAGSNQSGESAGASDTSASPSAAPTPAAAPTNAGSSSPMSGSKPNGGNQSNGQKPNQGPPDLDELWREFNRKLGGLFGGKSSQKPSNNPWANTGGGGGSGQRNTGGGNPFGGFPSFQQTGKGLVVVLGALFLIWLGTGFYIVQEGQQSVITRFGRYLGPEVGLKGAGFNWRMPWPIERHEIVRVSQLRSVDVGRNTVVQNSGLRDSSMLTQDENIVDIRFVVQYRLKDAAAYLFNHLEPDQAVVYASESAIREVVGKSTMNTVLNEKREAIASDIVKSIQSQLDLYKTGILVSSVNIQNVQPPEQVQAAFDDALKAGQDGDRAKNEGQAYANDVIPRAEGAAARLTEEAEGYKARVVAQAEGDSNRFKSVYQEYKKAPQVMRDRMYLDAMTQIYSNVSKVMVDSKQGNNLLYMPLDRIIQMTGQPGADAGPLAGSVSSAPATGAGTAGASPVVPTPAPDPRARENVRGRDREGR